MTIKLAKLIVIQTVISKFIRQNGYRFLLVFSHFYLLISTAITICRLHYTNSIE